MCVSPVDTNVREGWRGGGAPLLLCWSRDSLQQERTITRRSTLKQISRLQSMEDPILEQVDIP